METGGANPEKNIFTVTDRYATIRLLMTSNVGLLLAYFFIRNFDHFSQVGWETLFEEFSKAMQVLFFLFPYLFISFLGAYFRPILYE